MLCRAAAAAAWSAAAWRAVVWSARKAEVRRSSPSAHVNVEGTKPAVEEGGGRARSRRACGAGMRATGASADWVHAAPE